MHKSFDHIPREMSIADLSMYLYLPEFPQNMTSIHLPLPFSVRPL